MIISFSWSTRWGRTNVEQMLKSQTFRKLAKLWTHVNGGWYNAILSVCRFSPAPDQILNQILLGHDDVIYV